MIAGEFMGPTGPASTFTAINTWNLQLAAQGRAEIQVPDGHNCEFIVQIRLKTTGRIRYDCWPRVTTHHHRRLRIKPQTTFALVFFSCMTCVALLNKDGTNLSLKKL